MHARMNMDHRGKRNGEAGKRENGKRGDNHAAKAADRAQPQRRPALRHVKSPRLNEAKHAPP
jgi:hypothetical protein